MIKRLALLLTMTALFIIPTTAQNTFSSTDTAALEALDAALQNTTMQDSYRTDGVFVVDQTIDGDVEGFPVTVDQQIDQTMTGVVQRIDDMTYLSDLRIEQAIATDASGITTDIAQTLEFIVLEDTAWVRVSDVAPAEVAAAYPEGWTELNDAVSNPVFAAINPDQFVSSATNPVPLSLTPEVVTKFTAPVEDEIDGLVFERYTVALDPVAILNSDAATSVLGAFDFSQLGIDVDSFLNDFADGSTIRYDVWVDPETQLVARIISTVSADLDLEFTMQGQNVSFNLVQSATTTIDYSDYNQPVQIAAPTQSK